MRCSARPVWLVLWVYLSGCGWVGPSHPTAAGNQATIYSLGDVYAQLASSSASARIGASTAFGQRTFSLEAAALMPYLTDDAVTIGGAEFTMMRSKLAAKAKLFQALDAQFPNLANFYGLKAGQASPLATRTQWGALVKILAAPHHPQALALDDAPAPPSSPDSGGTDWIDTATRVAEATYFCAAGAYAIYRLCKIFNPNDYQPVGQNDIEMAMPAGGLGQGNAIEQIAAIDLGVAGRRLQTATATMAAAAIDPSSQCVCPSSGQQVIPSGQINSKALRQSLHNGQLQNGLP